MSNTELNGSQLLTQAKTALRQKDAGRADAFFAEHAERSLLKNKARVANDVR